MQVVTMILIFSSALALSLAVIPLVLRLANAYGFFDMPDHSHSAAGNSTLAFFSSSDSRRVHTRPVPRLGGIAIFLGFLVSTLVFSREFPIFLLLACSSLIFALGLIDDFSPISARLKLFSQLTIATAIVWFGDLDLPSVYLTPTFGIELPYFIGAIFSVFIVVGAINAINMMDGLDGLAGGIVIIGVSLLSYLHFFNTGDINLLLFISLPLIGATLGFLRFNSYPALIFMGDSGSNWLGFITGVVLLIVLKRGPVGVGSPLFSVLGTETLHPVPIISVLLCLAVPVTDTAFVILSRLKAGINPLLPDKRHFHHTLLKLGLNQSQSVATIYFIALSFGISGILPVTFGREGLWWVPYVSALLLILVFAFSITMDENVLEKLRSQKLAFQISGRIGVRFFSVVKAWESTNRYLIYGILVAAPLFAGVPPKPIGYAALVALLLSIFSILFLRRRGGLLESLGIAIVVTTLLSAINANPIWVELLGARYSLQVLYNACFVWLLVSSILLVALTMGKHQLLVTPSDFLLALVPLLVVLAPDPFRDAFRLNIIGLRSLILFLALRGLLKRHGHVGRRIQMLTIFSLVYVVLASLLGFRIVY